MVRNAAAECARLMAEGAVHIEVASHLPFGAFGNGGGTRSRRGSGKRGERVQPGRGVGEVTGGDERADLVGADVTVTPKKELAANV